MRAPRPPATPDPYQVAAAQQMANVEVAVANTALSNADEDTPEATVSFAQSTDFVTTNTYDSAGVVTGTRDVYRWIKTVALKPETQTQFDQQQDLAIAMNTWALAQVGLLQAEQVVPLSLADLTLRLAPPPAVIVDTSTALPGSITTTIGAADLTQHLATTRDAIDARLQYQIDLDRAARISALAHQGIVPGMTAYSREMAAFSFQSNDARSEAYLKAQQEQTRIVQLDAAKAQFANQATAQKYELEQSVIDKRNERRLLAYKALRDAAEFVNDQRTAELQERVAVRGQNINEISSLMHGGQVAVPQFAGFKAGTIAQTPVAESVYRSAAMDMQKWQQKVTNQQGMLGAFGAMFGNAIGASIGFA